MKAKPRRDTVSCRIGLRLRHAWAQSVQNANMSTWAHMMFRMHPYWKHVEQCEKCQTRIKAKKAETA